jgi:hypothetical protein
MKPTLGRIVHYVEHGLSGNSFEVAAIVTNQPEGTTVDLQLFGMASVSGVNIGNVPYCETKEPGTWHWPERE